jgi:hypothetical protein
MSDPTTELRKEAMRRGRTAALAVVKQHESNVVQDIVVDRAVNAALLAVADYIVAPPAPKPSVWRRLARKIGR